MLPFSSYLLQYSSSTFYSLPSFACYQSSSPFLTLLKGPWLVMLASSISFFYSYLISSIYFNLFLASLAFFIRFRKSSETI